MHASKPRRTDSRRPPAIRTNEQARQRLGHHPASTRHQPPFRGMTADPLPTNNTSASSAAGAVGSPTAALGPRPRTRSALSPGCGRCQGAAHACRQKSREAWGLGCAGPAIGGEQRSRTTERLCPAYPWQSLSKSRRTPPALPVDASVPAASYQGLVVQPGAFPCSMIPRGSDERLWPFWADSVEQQPGGHRRPETRAHATAVAGTIGTRTAHALGDLSAR
jgi:hypothetical protein